MDSIVLLTHQHRALEAAFDDALDDALDDAARARCFARVADELAVHIASEEQVFYPAVRARRTEDILLESLEEHLSLKRVLADLLALDPSEETFVPKLKVLSEQAEHHHKEEENHLFPKVLKLLELPQREALGRDMLALQQEQIEQGNPRLRVRDQTDAAEPLV
jgi:hemerythrin superfamily protein